MTGQEQSLVVHPKDEDDMFCEEFLSELQEAVANFFGGLVLSDGNHCKEKYVSALERGVVPKVWLKKAIIDGLKNA